jgi:hypothetical protein
VCVWTSWWTLFEQAEQLLEIWPRLKQWIEEVSKQMPHSRSLEHLAAMLKSAESNGRVFSQLLNFVFFAKRFVQFTYSFESDSFQVDLVFDELSKLGKYGKCKYCSFIFYRSFDLF